MKRAVTTLVLVFASLAVWAADNPEQVVTKYIEAYSKGVPGSELVETYWMPTLTTHSRGASANLVTAENFANVLESFRRQVAEQGWVRSEIEEINSCLLREDLAIVSLTYNRLYEDGSKSLDAVVYSLSGPDRWRLSSVWPVDTNAMIYCGTKK